MNEPTEQGVVGSKKILELVKGLTDSDLCLVVLSGGGSALLPAPADGISLSDKQMMTRLLMHGGATINELNCVRKQLSQIKGGGLARAVRAGRMLSLIISDVIGDPLDVIASGPTVADESTPSDALEIINRVIRDASLVPDNVRQVLQEKITVASHSSEISSSQVSNLLIGNNEVAVKAAEAKAVELGCTVQNQGSGLSGVASELGRDFAEFCLRMRDSGTTTVGPACVISGGEPVVRLAEIG